MRRLPCGSGRRRLGEEQGRGHAAVDDVVFNRVHKPIESAMESNRLLPSRLTCEQCHWPQMFDAVKLRVIEHFQEDAANTETQTVLMMMIGGGDLGGIHGKHMGPGSARSIKDARPYRLRRWPVKEMRSHPNEERTQKTDR